MAKFKPTLQGRMVGCLVAEGSDAAAVKALAAAVTEAGGVFKVVAPKLGGAIEADFQLAGGPSVLFDAVAIVLSAQGCEALTQQAAAVAFVHDAFSHLKVIAHSAAARPLLEKAGVVSDEGVVPLERGAAAAFVAAASAGRLWAREPKVRAVH